MYRTRNHRNTITLWALLLATLVAIAASVSGAWWADEMGIGILLTIVLALVFGSRHPGSDRGDLTIVTHDMLTHPGPEYRCLLININHSDD